MIHSRRDFLKKSTAATVAATFGGVLPGFSAKSYSNITGANDRVKVGIMGVNARGLALGHNYAKQKNCEILSISDVYAAAKDKCIQEIAGIQGWRPKGYGDFRHALEDKDLDALVIAAPDHWHAPATILACKAGKHVYVEKPCSHNPYEGELMVAAARKYNRKVQMGSQRRSWPNPQKAIRMIKDGAIGRVYYAKGWYAANRPSIGKGKQMAIPGDFDYELWQGPAPRTPFKDNIHPYNWHWFWNWGTGESGNNGTHFIDLMRWGLGVDYPASVRSVGGRYVYQDDWQTPDTQIITFEFPNKTIMEWEGRSCNGREVEGSKVGAAFYGEKGTMVLLGWNNYKLYDLDNKLLEEGVNRAKEMAAGSTVDPSQILDALHINNFLDAIRKDVPLAVEIEEGHKSTLLVHLGNIAQRTGNISLGTDSSNGHIIENSKAQKLWRREYEPGWEPVV